MTLRKPKDCAAGLMFLLIAVAAWYLSSGLGMGTARNMGPGYFPLALAALLGTLGALLVLRSFMGEIEPMGRHSRRTLRVLGAVLGAGLVFGFLVRSAGLAPTVLSTVLVSSFGLRGYGFGTALLIGTVLALSCCLVFVTLLGLPIKAIGPLLGN